MANPVEIWKAEKHGLDVWSDVERYAAAATPMKAIDAADLERMKWYGFFYRKRDEPGRYMNRIRITAGELSAPQAKEIARLAYDFGHGIVDVTTRANLQIQGLDIQHLPKARERLEQVGLTAKQTGHDNVRNVFGHPFSGLMPDELIDTRALCHAITALFLDSREYSDLPRKMNICLNGTPRHSSHFWTQDISFLATRLQTGEVVFHVLIGGTQGQNPHLAWRLPARARPDQVVDVTRAILDLFRERGTREKRGAARFRFLVEEMGPAGVLDWLQTHLPWPLKAENTAPVPASSHDDLIGWFPQADPHRWIMGLSVPLGRMTWRQLEGLGVLAERWGDGQLRVTHEQGIAVINIPTEAKAAALTDAAALGLTIHADALERNTMACTGSQFCNIAVTETKGQMFQLIEKLRKRPIRLEGIRIHMSGCPSSCAQHFTADIGLKGVRVRRLLGTREGYDVFLGGGIADGVQMGRVFRLGVDVDQLPTLIEEVVSEYYLRHRPGQTFSDYWRAKLPEDSSTKATDADYRPPTWQCEKCQYLHQGVDPPTFCPSCAGLRRYFARLEDDIKPEAATGDSAGPAASPPPPPTPTRRDDGFIFAASVAAVPDGAGLEVEVDGTPVALFLAQGATQGAIVALDGLCPHEGAPLAQGELRDGIVTCPWHGWTFDACTGCGVAPPGGGVKRHETLIADGNVFVKLAASSTGASQNGARPLANPAGARPLANPPGARPRAARAKLELVELRDEAPEVRTFRFDNSAGQIPLAWPGQFVQIKTNIDGRDNSRSFTVSSSPARPEILELTIKRNPNGVISRHLFERARVGDSFELHGPNGGFYFDPARHAEPLALVSAGSGATPMISIARYLRDHGLAYPCAFFHGARTSADILFEKECRDLATALPEFQYHVTLSRPTNGWKGQQGRIDSAWILSTLKDPTSWRYFLCGPDDFVERLTAGLSTGGVPSERIHSERFHAGGRGQA